jgi:hypothetical protein
LGRRCSSGRRPSSSGPGVAGFPRCCVSQSILSRFRQNATATHFERELAGARPTNAMAEGCQNSDSRFERRLVELSPSTLGSGSSRLRRLASHPLYSTGFIFNG